MSFSLIRLPNKVIPNILLNMNALERIFISVLSTRAKQIVTDLEMKHIAIFLEGSRNVKIMDCDHIIAINWNFGIEKANDRSIFIDAQYRREPMIRWQNQENMTLKQYLAHFMSIFTAVIPGTIYCLKIGNIHPLYYIQELISGLNVWQYEVMENCTDMYVRDILEGLHHARCLQFHRINFEDPTILPKICIPNYDEVYFRDQIPRKLTLNHLLSMNWSIIQIAGPSFTEKELNRFLKLWMSGCNPRLEFFQVDYTGQEMPGMNMITKGVHFLKLRDNVEQEFKYTFFKNIKKLRRGGYSIRNKNQKEAVFYFRIAGNERYFRMYVLH